MANTFRGQSDLKFKREVEGKMVDAHFKLQYDANALCEFEEESGLKLGQMLSAMEKPEDMSMKMIRALLWAGLVEHHEEITVKEAGNILSDAGMDATMAAMKKAFTGATKSAPGNVKAQK